MTDVVERFLRYVRIDTQSDENSQTCPSTKKQFELARLLVKELEELGLYKVTLDTNGYLMATLPANSDKELPVVGFIAHMDTSPDMIGKDVKPRIIENYDGGKVPLNEKDNIFLSPDDFPELKNYTGQTLITTDGTTLLGADDKAGVAEILTAMQYLKNHPDIIHGTIKIGFTPDEEIGRGADLFDVKKFGADFAYTLDGGEIGELEYENFNAALATITVSGRNVHPGTAKDKMVNSIHLAKELDFLLPAFQRPEHTEKYEGFFHLIDFEGDVEETTFRYIVRDHDRVKFEEKKQFLTKSVDLLNLKHGDGRFKLDLKDQYYNMKEKIEPVLHIVETAKMAMEEVGVVPIIKPIRGGTDGARLSFMGLPTPNIFTGGHNYHGRYEYIPVESMQKAVEVIVKIAQLIADNE